VQVSNRVLASATARLPQVELNPPRSAIGRNTVEAIQSALIFGTAGEVDAMIDRIADELGDEPAVIATGGLAPAVMPHCRHGLEHDPWLTLEGLRLVFERNVGADDA
jgi:type III pantothenate kinase